MDYPQIIGAVLASNLVVMNCKILAAILCCTLLVTSCVPSDNESASNEEEQIEYESDTSINRSLLDTWWSGKYRGGSGFWLEVDAVDSSGAYLKIDCSYGATLRASLFAPTPQTWADEKQVYVAFDTAENFDSQRWSKWSVKNIGNEVEVSAFGADDNALITILLEDLDGDLLFKVGADAEKWDSEWEFPLHEDNPELQRLSKRCGDEEPPEPLPETPINFYQVRCNFSFAGGGYVIEEKWELGQSLEGYKTHLFRRQNRLEGERWSADTIVAVEVPPGESEWIAIPLPDPAHDGLATEFRISQRIDTAQWGDWSVPEITRC